MKKLGLNEDFICRIWEDDSNYNGLAACSGEDIEVIDRGTRNYDAGPDYKDAKVKIGNIVYSGSIEIHRSVDDWYLHNHKGDNKYNNVILHVVFYGSDSGDTESPKVKRSRSIPTVILSEFLTRSVHEIWKDIINNPSPAFKLPCFPDNFSVYHSVKKEWLAKLSFERLIFKTGRFRSHLGEISHDFKKKIFWEQVLFEFICEALGYSKNKKQLLKLSGKIELNEIKSKKLSLTDIDSILFGLAGFLFDLRYQDNYINDLKSNWQRLKPDLNKEIMDSSEWNFFRLRPPNFPTLRIAYAAGLLYDILYKDLLKDIINVFEHGDNVKKELIKRFTDIVTSDYWKNHYNFGKVTESEIKIIGRERITDIIVNVILPLVYLYSEFFDKINLNKRTEYFYKKEKQKSGSNEITRVMEKQLDLKVSSLSDEQALIQLHNYYCVKGRCSECEIGKIIFSNEKVNEPLRIILY